MPKNSYLPYSMKSSLLPLFMLMRRICRCGMLILTCDFASLGYALFLRWHRLEFAYANFVSPEDGHCHAHSGGPALEKVIRALAVPKGSVALDLGVGMGIAALTLSPYFESVIGVDLSAELIDKARRNMARMHIRNVELYCADARVFNDGLDRVTHVYMFNPFPSAVMSLAMENLRRSVLRAPRRVTIIYKFPVCHDVIVATGFVHKCNFHFRHSHPFSIYEM